MFSWDASGVIVSSTRNAIKLLSAARSFADARCRFITGENGTGHELVAAAIHERSTRSAGPFVKLH